MPVQPFPERPPVDGPGRTPVVVAVLLGSDRSGASTGTGGGTGVGIGIGVGVGGSGSVVGRRRLLWLSFLCHGRRSFEIFPRESRYLGFQSDNKVRIIWTPCVESQSLGCFKMLIDYRSRCLLA